MILTVLLALGISTLFYGTPDRIIDGDTLVLQGQKIRLWGVDAPEMSDKAGPASKSALEALTAGKRILCIDTGTRSYERIVAICTVDGVDIGAILIQRRQAKPYCRFSGDAYDFAARKQERCGD
jgi:endonuclease YncB( thermonuclease family)